MATYCQSNNAPRPVPLVEGRDYYLENGYIVFTEYYLRSRQKCCGSGCRHCPYRKKESARTGTEPINPVQI
ncbi:MAG: DUF5522 domain-containing protein [Saprospiraceae bacterium]